VDLLWALRCPALFLYGDEDPVLPPDRLDDLRGRLARSDLGHELAVQPGAGHAFCAPVPPLRHEEADRASWRAATDFLSHRLPPGGGA
jgi:carboxymethylenebutenolidase